MTRIDAVIMRLNVKNPFLERQHTYSNHNSQLPGCLLGIITDHYTSQGAPVKNVLATADSNFQLSLWLILREEPSVTSLGIASETESLLALLNLPGRIWLLPIGTCPTDPWPNYLVRPTRMAENPNGLS